MPVDFPNLHVNNDRDGSVRQRNIPTASESQKTSSPPVSHSGDAISAIPAAPSLSLIRRPMHYEPLARHPISTTLLKVPNDAQLQADDFSTGFRFEHQPDKMIAYTGCLDGKHNFARIRVSDAKDIDVSIRYDKLNGLVQIQCYNSIQNSIQQSEFWEKDTASAVEDIVESIASSLIKGCQARNFSISSDAYNLVRFHQIDEHYQRIRSHPNFTLAGMCRTYAQRDVTSGAYFP